MTPQTFTGKGGFVQEGELREAFWLAGRWHNDWLFGLLHHEYRESR
jgi:RimJ/RimL family protein N-acetyltransferase